MSPVFQLYFADTFNTLDMSASTCYRSTIIFSRPYLTIIDIPYDSSEVLVKLEIRL